MNVDADKATTLPSTPYTVPVRAVTAPGGVRWHIGSGYEGIVTGDLVPNWFSLAGDPRVELAKRNSLREVYRVTLPSGVFFAKVFAHADLWGTLKRWVFGPPAVREFRVGQGLTAAGIGAIHVVAAGVAADGRRSVLISQEFAGAWTLADAWESHRFPPAQLIERVAGFLARTHAAHVLPRDTHADNLLVRSKTGSGQYEIVFADLAGIRVGRPVTDREAARNLAELYQGFRLHTTAAQRVRFLHAYADARFGQGRQIRKRWARLVETAAQAHQVALWAQRDRRILRTNAYFARVQLDDQWTARLVLRCRAHPYGLTPFAGERTPADWRQWLEQHLSDLEAAPLHGLPEDLHLYRDRAERWRGWWWRLAGSPLRRAFVIAHALRHRDLPAFHAPALFERRSWGQAESLLLVHRPPHTTPLRDALRLALAEGTKAPKTAGGDDNRHRGRELLRATGRLLADMVQRGVTAKPWTPDLFAVLPEAAPGPLAEGPRGPLALRVKGSLKPAARVVICDFHGLSVRWRPARSAVASAPAGLLRTAPPGLTRTDRLRFLLAYWRRLPRQLRPGDWKTLWKRIEARVQD